MEMVSIRKACLVSLLSQQNLRWAVTRQEKNYMINLGQGRLPYLAANIKKFNCWNKKTPQSDECIFTLRIFDRQTNSRNRSLADSLTYAELNYFPCRLNIQSIWAQTHATLPRKSSKHNLNWYSIYNIISNLVPKLNIQSIFDGNNSNSNWFVPIPKILFSFDFLCMAETYRMCMAAWWYGVKHPFILCSCNSLHLFIDSPTQPSLAHTPSQHIAPLLSLMFAVLPAISQDVSCLLSRVLGLASLEFYAWCLRMADIGKSRSILEIFICVRWWSVDALLSPRFWFWGCMQFYFINNEE